MNKNELYDELRNKIDSFKTRMRSDYDERAISIFSSSRGVRSFLSYIAQADFVIPNSAA